MHVRLQREPTTEHGTFGEVFIDDAHFAWSLEPEPTNIYPDIPAGTYTLVINYSPRFLRELPELLGVPGRNGVRIHPGNWASPDHTDTHGCILLGENRTAEEVLHSAAACQAFQSKLAEALKAGPVTMSIQDPNPERAA